MAKISFNVGKLIKRINLNYSPFDGSSEYLYVCNACGYRMDKRIDFCPKCGIRIVEIIEEHT